MLCYKVADRSAVKEALSDVRLYTKMKRPETGYTAVGWVVAWCGADGGSVGDLVMRVVVWVAW